MASRTSELHCDHEGHPEKRGEGLVKSRSHRSILQVEFAASEAFQNMTVSNVQVRSRTVQSAGEQFMLW